MIIWRRSEGFARLISFVGLTLPGLTSFSAMISLVGLTSFAGLILFVGLTISGLTPFATIFVLQGFTYGKTSLLKKNSTNCSLLEFQGKSSNPRREYKHPRNFCGKDYRFRFMALYWNRHDKLVWILILPIKHFCN